jgi:hypothetical protein
VPGRKITWNPLTGPPPAADGTWESCMVYVHDYLTVSAALQWLQSGQHQFASVVLDSVSDMQQRCVDQLVGTDPMKTQDWGQLLRTVSDTIRKFRDLVTHPTNPLWAVVFICMTSEKNGKWGPLVQGQLRDVLPYYVDICGYMFVNAPTDTAQGWPGNQLLISPHPQYEAGERVNGVLGPIVSSPNIISMLTTVIQASDQ